MQIISIPEQQELEKISIAEGEHLVGEFIGDPAGASLIVFGSVHGNETSGLRALRRVAAKLEKLKGKIRGRIYLLAGNTRAINKNVRFIDADLNRHWTPESVQRNSPGSKISTNRVEDIEQRELLEILDKVFSTAKSEVYAMDLHSTSAESTPFAMIGDTLRNREFAQKFPATFLLGIEEQLDSTILEYLNNLGAITLGFEAGQHTDKTAIDNQEALIWLALVNSEILSAEDVDVERYKQVLKKAMGERRIIEIRYRHAITEADEFKMELGYENFQPVRKGEILAEDRNGEVKAIEKSLILMPLYQSQGNDGFLPGVKRHPADKDSLVVNTRIARIFPLQIFHLLGFRKRRWREDKLVVSRRKYDTKSPFTK